MSKPFGELINEYLGWVRETFPGETLESQVEHLKEEIDELAKSDFLDVDEMADVFGLMVCISCRGDVNLFDAFRRKFEINKARKWELTERGWRHVKPQEAHTCDSTPCSICDAPLPEGPNE